MFHIDVFIAPSSVHGIGLFSNQFIKSRTVIYTVNPLLDLHLSPLMFAELNAEEQRFIQHYGFFDDFRNVWNLSHDHIRFCNHAQKANISLIDHSYLVALDNIDKGEELLQNYRELNTFEERCLKD